MTHDRGGGLPGLLGLRFRWRSREGELELEGFFNFFLSTIGTSVPERSARWVMLCGRLGRIRMASGRSSLVLETSIKRCDVRASRAGFRPVLGLTKPRAGGLLTVDLRRSAGYRDKSPGRCSPRGTARPGGLDGGRTAGQFRPSVGGMSTSAETDLGKLPGRAQGIYGVTCSFPRCLARVERGSEPLERSTDAAWGQLRTRARNGRARCVGRSK